MILYSLAFNYYYINFKSKPFNIPFNKLYEVIFNYFKELKYKRNIFI
jgi:hypothetical protein